MKQIEEREIAALNQLSGNKDFEVILKWFKESLKEAWIQGDKIKGVHSMIRAQGGRQELSDFLEQVELAKTYVKDLKPKQFFTGE